MQPRRASTFPESIPHVKRNPTAHSLPISQHHFASLGLEPTYGSAPSSTPAYFDSVPDLTPTSSSDSLPSFGIAPMQPHPTFNSTSWANSFTDPSGLNHISDITTMMFPSADPLAYPNPPMTTFENRHPQAFDRFAGTPGVGGMPQQLSDVDGKTHPVMFGPTSMPAGSGRSNEAHIFNPMPMYLMQGAQAYRGFPPPQSGGSHMPIPGSNMHSDDIMNQEDWSQSFFDPALGTPGTRPPLGPDSPFNQQGTPMGGWR
jgi:hypothetical protein